MSTSPPRNEPGQTLWPNMRGPQGLPGLFSGADMERAGWTVGQMVAMRTIRPGISLSLEEAGLANHRVAHDCAPDRSDGGGAYAER